MAKESNAVIAQALLTDIRSGKSLKKSIDSLAAYLVEERRLVDLKAIIRDVEKLLLKSDDRLYVHVTSAHEIDQQTEDEIKDIFQKQSGAKEVILEKTIDKSVIGGVRCETVDYTLDLTLRRQLQRLKTVE